jgi:hypothetical protein
MNTAWMRVFLAGNIETTRKVILPSNQIVEKGGTALHDGMDLDGDLWIKRSVGEQQVRRLLEDRIYISAYPSSDGRIQTLSWEDSIVKWSVAQFEQKAPGHLLFWNSDPPRRPPSFLADHSTPQYETLSFICVAKEYSNGPAKGQYIQFEVLWFLTAFELLNSEEREA